MSHTSVTKTTLQSQLNVTNRDALLQTDTVLALRGGCRTSLYNDIKAGRFPRPLKLGPRLNRWRAGEVFDWLRAQGAQSKEQ